MSVNRWKLFSMPVLMLGLASPLLVNCSGGIPGAGKLPGPVGDLADAAGGCPEMDKGDFASLKISGGPAVEGKVKGFLDAAYSLNKVVGDMEVDLIASCGELGKAIGMSDADVKADPNGGEGAKKVCGAVAAKVSDMLKANADAKLSVEIGSPKCYADIGVMQKCFADCGSPVKGGDLKASCQGGDISGTCSGKCSGSCTVDAGADCTGTCGGSCSGKCDANFSGKCGGNCKGKCDGKNSSGKCAGQCEGSCDASAEGSCQGTCTGKCSASCQMKAGASCSGKCSGGCSVEMKEPSCSGEFKPPSVDPSCQVSCAAKGAASAKCDPPAVTIKVAGKANSDVQKLVLALQTTLPKIVKIQLGTGKNIVSSVVAVGKAGADLKSVATSAGAKALVCIASAIKTTATASASINVNVQASASVGGSVKGGT